MLFAIRLLALCLALVGVNAQAAEKCSAKDLACHDIMNSSQCIAQVVDNKARLTKEALIKCVEHEGTASPLSGAAKLMITILPVQMLTPQLLEDRFPEQVAGGRPRIAVPPTVTRRPVVLLEGQIGKDAEEGVVGLSKTVDIEWFEVLHDLDEEFVG
ncbi:hypothetical protein OQA88_6924 [Cercophora sp. LCS_1]